MRININSLKGIYVYLISEKEPCGRVTGVYFSGTPGYIDALSIETLSIIPIKKKVYISDVQKITNEKIVLKRKPQKADTNNYQTLISDKSVIKIKDNRNKIKKVNDINFDFETGEILDYVIKGKFFNKKENISATNAESNRSIIYIE